MTINYVIVIWVSYLKINNGNEQTGSPTAFQELLISQSGLGMAVVQTHHTRGQADGEAQVGPVSF